MSEIHRADPALRRVTIYIVVIIAAVGAAGLVILLRWFTDVQTLPPDEAWTALLGALLWMTGVMLLLVMATSIYAWRLGTRIKQVNQYPPQGARTFRDTVILEGAKARSRGNLLRAIGALLLVLAMLLLLLSVRLASMFSANAA